MSEEEYIQNAITHQNFKIYQGIVEAMLRGEEVQNWKKELKTLKINWQNHSCSTAAHTKLFAKIISKAKLTHRMFPLTHLKKLKLTIKNMHPATKQLFNMIKHNHTWYDEVTNLNINIKKYVEDAVTNETGIYFVLTNNFLEVVKIYLWDNFIKEDRKHWTFQEKINLCNQIKSIYKKTDAKFLGNPELDDLIQLCVDALNHRKTSK